MIKRTSIDYSEAAKLNTVKSREISAKKHAEFVAKYLADPKCCKYCHKQLAFEKRYNDFCSQACAANYNNGSRIVRRNCLYCNKVINKGSKKYCSVACLQMYRAEEAIKNGTASWVTIRNYLLKTNRKCSDCGLTEWNGQPIPLEIHHKDGDSKNNKFDNLVLICPNCHALTPNYKNRNKGNGREDRRQIYQRGKSGTNMPQ